MKIDYIKKFPGDTYQHWHQYRNTYSFFFQLVINAFIDLMFIQIKSISVNLSFVIKRSVLNNKETNSFQGTFNKKRILNANSIYFLLACLSFIYIYYNWSVSFKTKTSLILRVLVEMWKSMFPGDDGTILMIMSHRPSPHTLKPATGPKFESCI